MDDTISRRAAINALIRKRQPVNNGDGTITITIMTDEVIRDVLNELPSAQPERMTNRQWVDFLSAQFDISRTSAKEMLHGMMRWKKEDNFKKLFNGGKT